MKICKICSVEKPLDQFNLRADSNTHRSECKECLSIKQKAYRERNKEKLKERIKNKYWQDPETYRQKAKQDYEQNKDKRKQKANEYYYENREKCIAAGIKRAKERNKTDIKYRYVKNLRNVTWYALQRKNFTKKGTFGKSIGLDSFEQLRDWIKQTFKPGMTEENYGTYWDIDHIVPLSTAERPEDVYKLGHYTNLRALERTENRNVKRDKFSFKEECTVKLIDYNQGQEFLLEHHYLRRKAPARFTFGLFLSNGALVGVATFAVPFSVFLKKMICGEEHKDNVIELNRLAVRDYMPKNTESWFVAQCLNSGLIDKDILVTFADTAQGHQGTIYKALNFIYTGTTKASWEYDIEGHSYRPGMQFKGKNLPLRKRSVKHRFVYFIRNKKKLLPLLKI